MSSVNERIALTLEEALDALEFALDAASVDYQTCDTPNVNQYSLISAEEPWDGEPAVFVDIYIVGADGTEPGSAGACPSTRPSLHRRSLNVSKPKGTKP